MNINAYLLYETSHESRSFRPRGCLFGEFHTLVIQFKVVTRDTQIVVR
jgi:hypothetical protein